MQRPRVRIRRRKCGRDMRDRRQCQPIDDIARDLGMDASRRAYGTVVRLRPIDRAVASDELHRHMDGGVLYPYATLEDAVDVQRLRHRANRQSLLAEVI